MNEEKYYIPKHLDEPPRWLFWTLDEACALLLPVILNLMVFNHLIVGLGIGISMMLLLRKLKGAQGHYFLMNLIYWHLPVSHFQVTPPSYIREYLG